MLSKETALLALPGVTWWAVKVRGWGWKDVMPAWGLAGVALLMRVVALSGVEAFGGDERVRFVGHLPVLLIDGLRGIVTMRPTGLRHLSHEYEALGALAVAGATLGVVVVAQAAWRVRETRPLFGLFVAIWLGMLAPIAMVTTISGWGGFGRFLYTPAAFAALAAGAALKDAPRGVLIGVAVVVFGWQQIGLQRALDDWSTQEAMARSGIRDAPGNGVHFHWLGELAQADGRLPDAEAYYQRSVDLTPTFDPAWVNLASVQRERGSCDEALATVAAYESHKGDFGPGGSLIYALCMIEAKDYDAAYARLEAALARGHDPQLAALKAEMDGWRAP